MADAPACTPPTVDADHISGRLVTLAMLHRRLAGQLLAAHGLHVGQERLLFLIADGPRALGDLAAVMAVNAPTVTKMVGRLEAAGLVEVAHSPDDGRVRLAALTPGGREAVLGAAEAWQALEASTVGDLTADERARLAALLDRCTERLRTTVDHDARASC